MILPILCSVILHLGAVWTLNHGQMANDVLFVKKKFYWASNNEARSVQQCSGATWHNEAQSVQQCDGRHNGYMTSVTCGGG